MTGRTLGHYVIAERLGGGGMGEVYRARDTRLERDVALKVVSSERLESDDSGRGLRKEALALSRLSHPNIAAIHDFDIIDGIAFVVMELVPGADLQDRIRPGGMVEQEALELAVQAADALRTAHESGIIHRDLKPGNIRVTPEGRLKILDFGLAVIRDTADRPPQSTHTAQSLFAGTLPYMAPEQLRGKAADVRTDIYALSAVIYEMVTGRKPFEADTSALLVDQILNHAPPPPRDRNATISVGLNALIQKGLDQDPGRRYQSVTEMLVDLERLRFPSPVRPASPTPRWTRWSLTRRGLIAASLVLVSAALGWALWRVLEPRPALAFAARDWILVTEFDNQTGESIFDTALSTAFTVGLSQSTYANVVSRVRIDQTLARMGRKDSPRIDEAIGREICIRDGIRGLLATGISKIGQQYSLTGRLVDPKTGATVRSYVERANTADGILDALDRISRALRRDVGESLASVSDSRPFPQVTTASLEALRSYADGQARWQKGQYREAVVLFERATALDPDFAMAHEALGNAFLSFVFNEPGRGREHYDRALSLVDRITERERLILEANYESKLGDRIGAVDRYKAFLFRYPDDYIVRFNLAGLLRELERFDEAATEYEQVLRQSPEQASAHINLATALEQAGRHEQALEAYARAFALEPTWKNGGNLNHEYGFVFVRLNRLEDARRIFALTQESPDERPRGLRSLALLDMYRGRYHAAANSLQEAVRLDGPLNRPLTEARDRLFLAIVQRALGDWRGSLDSLERSEQALAKLEGVSFLARVGIEFARAGDVERAQRVIGLARKKLHEEPFAEGEVLRLEAECLLARGQPAAAVQLLREAARHPNRQRILVQQSSAFALARAGDTTGARTAYEEFLGLDALGWEPQHYWFAALYELAAIEAANGLQASAVASVDRLLTLWKDGDPDLPLLVAAKRLRKQLAH